MKVLRFAISAVYTYEEGATGNPQLSQIGEYSVSPEIPFVAWSVRSTEYSI